MDDGNTKYMNIIFNEVIIYRPIRISLILWNNDVLEYPTFENSFKAQATT